MTLLPSPPARLLDLGCGGGWTSVFYARRGYQVVGQDIASDMIALATENRDTHGLNRNHLDFVCGDFEVLDKVGLFDCAIFFDALHHADDEAAAIQRAYDALKPGGVLITHEPGVGHSIHPNSIETIERFGVNERDMPPRLVVARGIEAGFSDYRVLPMPECLINIFYGNDGSSRCPSIKRRYRIMKRLYRALFKPDMNAGSIVVLTK